MRDCTEFAVRRCQIAFLRVLTDDDAFVDTDIGQVVAQDGKGGSHFFIRASRSFDFQWIEGLVVFDDKVDFFLVGIAVVVKRRFQAVIAEGFDDFADDKGFKELPAFGALRNGFWRQPATEPGHKAGVQQVEFRCFDGAFQMVVAVWRQQVDDVGSLQDGEPALGGICRDARILGEVGVVEQFATARRDCRHEAGEIATGADIGELAHVAFNVGGDVGGVVDVPVGFLFVEARHIASVDVLPDVIVGGEHGLTGSEVVLVRDKGPVKVDVADLALR